MEQSDTSTPPLVIEWDGYAGEDNGESSVAPHEGSNPPQHESEGEDGDETLPSFPMPLSSVKHLSTSQDPLSMRRSWRLNTETTLIRNFRTVPTVSLRTWMEMDEQRSSLMERPAARARKSRAPSPTDSQRKREKWSLPLT